MSILENKIEIYKKALRSYRQAVDERRRSEDAYEESQNLQTQALSQLEETRKVMMQAIENELWNKVPPA